MGNIFDGIPAKEEVNVFDSIPADNTFANIPAEAATPAPAAQLIEPEPDVFDKVDSTEIGTDFTPAPAKFESHIPENIKPMAPTVNGPIPAGSPQTGSIVDPTEKEYRYKQEEGLTGVAGSARDLTKGGFSGLLRGGEMAADTLEWFAPEGTSLEGIGNKLSGKIKTFRESQPGTFGESKQSQEAREGSDWNPRGWWFGGGESVGMMAPGMTVSMVNPLAGAALTGGLFWGGTAQESYDEINEKRPDLPEMEKIIYANQKGFFEGGVEMVQQAIPFGIAKAIPKRLKSQIIKKAVGGKVAVDIIKDYLKVVAGETGTEMFQEWAGEATDYEYDLREDMPGIKETYKVIGPTIITSGLLMTSATLGSADNRAGIQAALSDPNAPPEMRQQAVDSIHQAILAEKAEGSQELANAWMNTTAAPLRDGTAIIVQDDSYYRENGINPPREVLLDAMLLSENENDARQILEQAADEDKQWLLENLNPADLTKHLEPIKEMGGPANDIQAMIENVVGIKAEQPVQDQATTEAELAETFAPVIKREQTEQDLEKAFAPVLEEEATAKAVEAYEPTPPPEVRKGERSAKEAAEVFIRSGMDRAEAERLADIQEKGFRENRQAELEETFKTEFSEVRKGQRSAGEIAEVFVKAGMSRIEAEQIAKIEETKNRDKKRTGIKETFSSGALEAKAAEKTAADEKTAAVSMAKEAVKAKAQEKIDLEEHKKTLSTIPKPDHKRMKLEAKGEVDADPIYKAIKDAKSDPINLGQLKLQYPDIGKELSKKFPAMVSGNGRVQPDAFAEKHGWESVDAMVESLKSAPTQKAALDKAFAGKVSEWGKADKEMAEAAETDVKTTPDTSFDFGENVEGKISAEKTGEAAAKKDSDTEVLATPETSPEKTEKITAKEEAIETIDNKDSVGHGQELNTSPTEKQKDADNYKKIHTNKDGLKISIETALGTTRKWTDEDGNTGEQVFTADYGDIKGTLGFDKDHVDIFLKPGYEGGGETVFVVNQNKKNGTFDEHKPIMGATSEAEAIEIYNSNYEKGWDRIESVVAMPTEEFKVWVKSDAPSKGPAIATEKAGNNVEEYLATLSKEERAMAEENYTPAGLENIANEWAVENGLVEPEVAATPQEKTPDTPLLPEIGSDRIEVERTFEPKEGSTTPVPESLEGVMSPAADGAYYFETAESLQAWLDKNGDGWLYRTTIVESFDKDGYDAGQPGYKHRFSEPLGIKKETSFSTTIDYAKASIKENPDAIIYRIKPADIDTEFLIAVHSNEGKGVLHVHSAKKPHGTAAEILYSERQWETEDSGRLPKFRQGESASEGREAEQLHKVPLGRPSSEGQEVAEPSPTTKTGKKKSDRAIKAQKSKLQSATPDTSPKDGSITHVGLKIYPAELANGNKYWAVQLPENQGTDKVMGDTLHGTIEEAKTEAEDIHKHAANKAAKESKAAATDAQAKKEAKAKESDDVQGFTSDLNGLQTGRTKKALNKQFRFEDGGVMTVRERVEALAKSGELEVSTYEENKIKPMSRRAYNRADNQEQEAHDKRVKDGGKKTVYQVNGSELGKIGHDYANYLLNKPKFSKSTPEFKPVDTESPEFNEWSGGLDIIEGTNIAFADSGQGYIFKVAHGTTHEFDVFDPTVTGNKEGQFGAVNYFTSDDYDAEENYGEEGPDLTQRIELLAERLVDAHDVDDVAAEYGIDPDELEAAQGNDVTARQLAAEKLSGGASQTLDMYVKSENPAFIGGDTTTWIDNDVKEQYREDATQEVLDENNATIEDIDEYEDQIYERIEELSQDDEIPIVEAFNKALYDAGLSPDDVPGGIGDIAYEPEVTATELEAQLREIDSDGGIEDRETGDIITSHIIGETFKNLGFDAIVLQDANQRFKQMNMSPNTSHVHVFEETPSNIKSAEENTGEFSKTDPRFRYSKGTTPSKSTIPQIEQKITEVAGKDAIDNLNIDIFASPEDYTGGGVTITAADGTVEGMYNPKTGRIAIFANNVAEARVWGIVLHESIHSEKAQGGWAAVFGNKHAGIMKSIDAKLKLNNPAWKAAEQKAVDAGTPSESIQEETIAYFMADNANQKQSLWKRIANAIRAWAVNIGLTRTISDTDIVALAESSIQRAARKTEPIGAVPELATAAMYSDSPLWHSRLRRLVNDFQAEKQPASAWLSTFNSWKKKGKLPPALQEELEWSGLEEVLELRGKEKVTKGEILDLMATGGVQVEDTVLGDISDKTIEQSIISGSEKSELREFLKGADYLGFDTMIEARSAISQNPDWAERWDVTDPRFIELGNLHREYRAAREKRKSSKPKFADYQLPGGENYREMLITLPSESGSQAKDAFLKFQQKMQDKYLTPQWIQKITPEEDAERGILAKAFAQEDFNDKDFKSSHFDQPNILAHVRMNDRVDADGNKVLFVEEIQSDWHQAGRKKGYAYKAEKVGDQWGVYRQDGSFAEHSSKDEAESAAKKLNEYGGNVPDAPFKKTWSLLAMKRMIQKASEEGYDKIAWTTGEQQAERYDLSKQVDEIKVSRLAEDGYQVGVYKDGRVIANQSVKEAGLSDLVGKDLAEKIISDDLPVDFHKHKKYSGLDLKVGGEGMKGFYDKILPSTVGKFIKKYGGKVGQTTFMNKIGEAPISSAGFERVHSLDITPKMQEAAATEGMPLFAKESIKEDAKEGGKLIDAIIAKMKTAGQFDENKVTQTVKKYEGKLSSLKKLMSSTSLDTTEKQKEVRDVLNKLPIHVRGRALNEIVKVGQFKTEAGRERAVARAMGRIVTLLDQYYVTEGIKEIDKKLKAAKVKVRGSVARGTTTPETLAELEQIKGIMKMSFDEIGARLDEIIPDDSTAEPTDTQIAEMALLNTFGTLRQKTSEEVSNAVDHLQTVIDEGKFLWKLRTEAEKARRRELADMATEVIQGDQEEKGENIPGRSFMAEIIGEFSDKSQNWQWLMDKLSRFDRTSDVLRSRLSDHFARAVHAATHRQNAGEIKQEKILRDKAEEIFDASGGKLGRILLKNGTIIEKKSGINLYNEDGSVKNRDFRFSQNTAYKKWQEWQNLDLRDDLIRQGITEKTMKEIENFMTPEVKEWAQWQIETFYDEYYDSINEVFRAITYTDMPKSKWYSPIRRIFHKGDTSDMTVDGSASYHASILKASNKRRVKNNLDIDYTDGDTILAQHIAEMEHFKAWALVARDMRSVFGNPKVRKTIKDHHGKKALQTVDIFIEDFVRGGVDARNNIAMLDAIRSLWVKTKLAGNLVVFIKQLTSIPAYAVEIPTKDFMVGIVKAMANPRKAARILMGSVMMQARYEKNQIDRDMQYATQKGPARKIAGTKKLSDKAMFTTRMGDKAAIILGGYAVYDHHYRKQMKLHGDKELANKVALEEFEVITENTQQATARKDLSVYQTGDSIQKGMTMFMTALSSYARMWEGGARNLKIPGIKKGRGDQLTNLKRIFYAQIVLPTLFQLAASGFDWDEEKQRRARWMGPLNGLFIFRDLLAGVYDIIFLGKAWGMSAQPHLEEVSDLLVNLVDGDLQLKDIAGIVNVSRLATGIKDYMTGETDDERRLLGYSEYALNTVESGYTRYNHQYNKKMKAWKEDRTQPRPSVMLKSIKSQITKAKKSGNKKLERELKEKFIVISKQ